MTTQELSDRTDTFMILRSSFTFFVAICVPQTIHFSLFSLSHFSKFLTNLSVCICDWQLNQLACTFYELLFEADISLSANETLDDKSKSIVNVHSASNCYHLECNNFSDCMDWSLVIYLFIIYFYHSYLVGIPCS